VCECVCVCVYVCVYVCACGPVYVCVWHRRWPSSHSNSRRFCRLFNPFPQPPPSFLFRLLRCIHLLSSNSMHLNLHFSPSPFLSFLPSISNCLFISSHILSNLLTSSHTFSHLLIPSHLLTSSHSFLVCNSEVKLTQDPRISGII
jgi:hypothetical protein